MIGCVWAGRFSHKPIKTLRRVETSFEFSGGLSDILGRGTHPIHRGALRYRQRDTTARDTVWLCGADKVPDHVSITKENAGLLPYLTMPYQ